MCVQRLEQYFHENVFCECRESAVDHKEALLQIVTSEVQLSSLRVNFIVIKAVQA